MVARPAWLQKLDATLNRGHIAWISGVRRVGKTTLVRQLEDTEYLNCDLPSVRERARDPEHLFREASKGILVFDEVHQLEDPSQLLKIGADEFPALKLVATGSSTLAATTKFRDSLTGRKRSVVLTPVLADELPTFGVKSLQTRLLHGGLPEALLAGDPPSDFYAEWLDSYFARDVQELFRLEKRSEFLRFIELLLRQSGHLFEVSSLAKHAGVSRPTIGTWLGVLETTHVARILRPYHAGSRREILAQPKVYAFDTGFVAWACGWNELRPDEQGTLWEHLVLDALLYLGHDHELRFWRDKQQREIDFVVDRGRGECDAIECKIKPDAFEPRALSAFREHARSGKNLVVCPRIRTPYARTIARLEVRFCSTAHLEAELARSGPVRQ